MPINIYKEENFETISIICNENWDLPTQIAELEKWLIDNSEKLENYKNVIDIGFNSRKDASGGGAVLSSRLMKIMVDNNCDLYLSEYASANNK